MIYLKRLKKSEGLKGKNCIFNENKNIFKPKKKFALGSCITYIIYPQDEKIISMWEPFMGRLILTFSYKKW